MQAIHTHVEAHVKNVLVNGGVELRGHQGAILGHLAGGKCRRADHARELDLVLNVAVLVEVPVEAVLVVAHGGNEGDD